MLSLFRRRVGIPGLISVIALVFALAGGAIAAVGLNPKQKKEVKKIAKKFAGKPGKPGAVGPAGPQGPAGAAGAKGDKGDKGDTGSAGAKGATGATGPAGAAGATGAKGATGPTGATGATGSVTVPTLTGTFTTVEPTLGSTGVLGDGEVDAVPVSFEIPLAAAPTFVFVPPASGTAYGSNSGAGCPGVDPGHLPKAAAGKFCVYLAPKEAGPGVAFSNSTVDSTEPGTTNAETEPASTGRSGATLWINCAKEPAPKLEFCAAAGVWAATG